jgi:hypothetical protein
MCDHPYCEDEAYYQVALMEPTWKEHPAFKICLYHFCKKHEKEYNGNHVKNHYILGRVVCQEKVENVLVDAGDM